MQAEIHDFNYYMALRGQHKKRLSREHMAERVQNFWLPFAYGMAFLAAFVVLVWPAMEDLDVWLSKF